MRNFLKDQSRQAYIGKIAKHGHYFSRSRQWQASTMLTQVFNQSGRLVANHLWVKEPLNCSSKVITFQADSQPYYRHDATTDFELVNLAQVQEAIQRPLSPALQQAINYHANFHHQLYFIGLYEYWCQQLVGIQISQFGRMKITNTVYNDLASINQQRTYLNHNPELDNRRFTIYQAIKYQGMIYLLKIK